MENKNATQNTNVDQQHVKNDNQNVKNGMPNVNENVKNQNIKSRKKRPSFIKNVQQYWFEWTESTSIHGVRYLGERRRNVFERLWWLVMFAFALSCCTFWINSTYKRFANSPVTVPTPIWEIPFPAVTICPDTKIKQTVYNFTHNYHLDWSDNMTDDERKEYQNTALVCDSQLFEGGDKYADNNAIDFITQVAPEFDEVFFHCIWTNRNETCGELFTPVLTEAGLCYNFNMIDRDDMFLEVEYKEYLKHGKDRHGWTLENGYLDNAEKDTFPRRVISAGARAGLTVVLTGREYDFDYICNGPVQGFKVLLHRPDETPRMNSEYFRVGFNQDVAVSVKPNMITTSFGIKEFPSDTRKCYFPTERVLKFYRDYTQQNCEIECLANYTLNRCNCVAYHMPRISSTNVCGAGKIHCMEDAHYELLSERVTAYIKAKSSEYIELYEVVCNCLPDCTTLSYTAETSQSSLNWPAFFQAVKSNMNEYPGYQFSRLTIFFKEMQFIPSLRNELYSMEDFLANCGGILGLFIGFSFLSVAETIYFLTLRLWCNVRIYGRHFWSGTPESVNHDED